MSARMELAFDDRGSGAPLLLVHPFPLDARYWEKVAIDLARDHRVLTPDLAGFGRSRELGPPRSIEDHATDLVRLLDHLRIDRIAFAGLSMGGYVALAFAARFADRLEALVLADTRAAADSAEGRAGRDRLIALVRSEGVAALVAGALPNLLSAGAAPEVTATARAIGLDQSPSGVVAAITAMRDRPDRTAELGTIGVPTLVLVGEHDGISPPDEMRGIAAAIPHAQFVVIEGVGHLASLEAPARFTDELRRFLARP